MPDSNIAAEIAAAYNGWANTYEKDRNRTRDLAAATLRGQSLDLTNRDALEIGCGTGVNTRFLAERCRSVAALDFSFGMLAQARANVRATNARFAQQDLRLDWQIADSAVDLVVCTLVLEHLEDLRHVFSEAWRVLRANGEFFVCELHPFRQLLGGQAQFKPENSATAVLIPAFRHSVSEFVNTTLAANFQLVRLDEPGDREDQANNAPPRLLALHARKS